MPKKIKSQESSGAGAASATLESPSEPTVLAGCPACAGTGFRDKDTNKPFCTKCKGHGALKVVESATAVCDECHGKGHAEHTPCMPCRHTGRVLIDEQANVIAKQKDADLAKQRAVELQAKYDAGFAAGKKAGYEEYLSGADKNK